MKIPRTRTLVFLCRFAALLLGFSLPLAVTLLQLSLARLLRLDDQEIQEERQGGQVYLEGLG